MGTRWLTAPRECSNRGKPRPDEYDCHWETISAILRRQDVALRRTSPTSEQVDEMVRFHESGLSLAKVVEQFTMNASTLLAQLREKDIRTRDAHGRDR